MNVTQQAIQLYFKSLSALSPALAGKKAAALFQKPQQRKLRAPERVFYADAHSRSVPYSEGEYHLFESGNSQGELVILVHGWNSNAGSMAGIGSRLAQQGRRVIAIDLPGHGLSVSPRTNIVRMSVALEHLLLSLKGSPCSIVSHSMGSAVTSYALRNTGISADKLIFLTSPNTMEAVFEEYRDMIGLGTKAYAYLKRMVEAILDTDMETATVSNFLNQSTYESLLIIHDRTDRVIPFDYAVDLFAQTQNSRYLPLEQTGHYRMLWTEDVLDMIVDELEGKLAPRYGFASLDYRNNAWR